MRTFYSFLIPFCVVGGLSGKANAESQPIEVMDLEALMSMDVQATSVMKRVESVKDTAASIYVLTEEQIRLSGVNNLTEAVSLLPGVYYREINNNQRAVGIRQVPDALSTGFLVMIDGKYVYNPIFPGTIWEHLSIPLTNIDRIELIRGSAGTLWSSKANNGVINVITKHSIDTQGFELIAGVGNMEQALGEFRYGGLFGDGGSFRINVAGRKIGESGDYVEPAHDAHRIETVNSRLDYTFSDDLSLIFKASYLNADSDVTYNDVSTITSRAAPEETFYKADKINLVLRLDHRLSATQTQQLQVNYADGSADILDLSGDLQILNINYSMNTELLSHKLDWGLEYQLNQANTAELPGKFMVEGDNDSDLENFGLFIQDEYSFQDGQSYLISGVRVDDDPNTGWEFQPSLRFMHHLNSSNRIWGGISRSITTPTDYSRRIKVRQHSTEELFPTVFIPTYITGSPEFDTEKFDNLELGYRGQFDTAEIDLSLFYQTSDNALAFQPLGTSAPLELNLIAVNGAEVTRQGADIVVNLQPLYNWSVQLSMSYLYQTSEADTGFISGYADSATQKQIAIRSDYRHTERLSSYLRMRYQSKLEAPDDPIVTADIPEFVSLDAGLTWLAADGLELGLYGRNLFGSHPEFPSNLISQTYSTEIEPSITARAIWRF